ncbi:MAG: hypothetical protein ACI4RI_02045 [Ruminococcus sp.]
MKLLKKAVVWFVLLAKRFFKKPVFILILSLIPLFVVALNVVAHQDGGVVSVALVQENKEDELSSEIVEDLLSEDSIIRYVQSDADESKKLLQTGKVDSVWIFSDDFQKRTDKLAIRQSQSNYLVRVVEREKTASLLLLHEKLYGTLFRFCSESLYMNFATENVEELKGKSEEQLMVYYDNVHSDDSLFDYSHIGSNSSSQNMEGAGYLVTPLRGIFSILIILCGLAVAMMFQKDVSKGVFSWIPHRTAPVIAGVYHYIPIIIISVVSLISLMAVGLTGSLTREILMIILYSFCCTLFCMIIRLLCGNIKILSVLTPVIVVALFAICPVFYDFEALRAIQMLFPTFYYLKAVYSDAYLLYMAVYCVVSALFYMVLCKIIKTV